MLITKGNIAVRAGEELRIWGITSNITPEITTSLINRLDELAAALTEDGLNSGYLYPDEYGYSDPDDDSGLELWMVQPFSVLLARDAAASFGPTKLAAVDQQKVMKANESLENGLVEVEGSKYPETLPVGTGNDNYIGSGAFYRGNEPAEG